MKTVMVHINDESKFPLFVGFLKELRFIEIEECASPIVRNKKMTCLPKSVLNPVRVKEFKMFNKEDLHDRKSIY